MHASTGFFMTAGRFVWARPKGETGLRVAPMSRQGDPPGADCLELACVEGVA